VAIGKREQLLSMVDSSKIEYVQSGQLIAATYVKNSKAIGFLWGVFSICYAIITLVVFVQPQWIGSQVGYFGLWKHCSLVLTEASASKDAVCIGRLDDLGSLLNPGFKAATGFLGLAALVSSLSVFALILFICTPTTVAYRIVSWMHTIAAVSTTIGIIIFPVGWDTTEVKSICGVSAGRFTLGSGSGSCTIRWAYVLAIIAALDGIVLAVLGFVLGSKHVKLIEDMNSNMKKRSIQPYQQRFYYSTESDPTPSVTMSYASTKRSLNLQPVVLIPPDHDGYSEFSQHKGALYRANYSMPSQQFQL
jgi:hypothetical protein